MGGLVGAQDGSPPGLVTGLRPQGGQLPSRPVQPQRGELVDQVTVATSRVGLSLQGSDLSAHLAQEVRQPVQVDLGGPQAPLGLLLAAPVLQDSGGVLDDHSPFLGAGVQDGVDLALGDDDVLLATNTDVGEHLLDVQQPTGCAVHRVLAVPAPKQRASDGHLAELDRQQSRRVVDGQGDLRPTQGGPRGGAGEDDVVHLLGPHGARSLGAEHPRDGIDDVGLAASVWTHQNGDPGLHLQRRSVRERLEALDGQSLQEHVDSRVNEPRITRVSFTMCATLGAYRGRGRAPVIRRWSDLGLAEVGPATLVPDPLDRRPVALAEGTSPAVDG